MLRDLHANAWVLALQALAPKAVRNWRGPRVERASRRRGRAASAARNSRSRSDLIPLGGSRRLRDPSLATPEPVHPAGAVELRVGLPGEPVVFDLLVELVRGRRACTTRPARAATTCSSRAGSG